MMEFGVWPRARTAFAAHDRQQYELLFFFCTKVSPHQPQGILGRFA
jgi:hypothetical protein